MAAAFLISIMGCGTNTAPPTDSAESGGKGSHVLSNECLSLFRGITHCPTGHAVVAKSDNLVSVTEMRVADEDGVESSFDAATSWTQSARIIFPDEHNGGVTFSALGDGTPVSTLRLEQSAGDAGYRVTPNFTSNPEGEGGSDYLVQVFKDGAEITPGGVTAQARQIHIINWRTGEHWWVYPWQLDPDFWIVTDSDPHDPPIHVGACGWRLRSIGDPFTITLDDGTQWEGDEVKFTEILDGGASPYSGFTGMRVTGTALRYDIAAETARH
jgi:hypothetical protein